MVCLDSLSLLVKNEWPNILHDSNLISIGCSRKSDQVSLTCMVQAVENEVIPVKWASGFSTRNRMGSTVGIALHYKVL
jgi:hypothetical protein